MILGLTNDGLHHNCYITGILSPEDAPTIIPPMARDTKDASAIVNYSVMLYYTQEVEDNVADLDGFFDQMLAETNQGEMKEMLLMIALSRNLFYLLSFL